MKRWPQTETLLGAEPVAPSKKLGHLPAISNPLNWNVGALARCGGWDQSITRWTDRGSEALTTDRNFVGGGACCIREKTGLFASNVKFIELKCSGTSLAYGVGWVHHRVDLLCQLVFGSPKVRWGRSVVCSQENCVFCKKLQIHQANNDSIIFQSPILIHWFSVDFTLQWRV